MLGSGPRPADQSCAVKAIDKIIPSLRNQRALGSMDTYSTIDDATRIDCECGWSTQMASTSLMTIVSAAAEHAQVCRE